MTNGWTGLALVTHPFITSRPQLCILNLCKLSGRRKLQERFVNEVAKVAPARREFDDSRAIWKQIDQGNQDGYMRFSEGLLEVLAMLKWGIKIRSVFLFCQFGFEGVNQQATNLPFSLFLYRFCINLHRFTLPNQSLSCLSIDGKHRLQK